MVEKSRLRASLIEDHSSIFLCLRLEEGLWVAQSLLFC
jgi:hypothetical protein